MTNNIKEFVVNWNLNYPIDRWWRQKHNIAFGSKEHKASSLIYQRIEFEEDVLFKKATNAKKKDIPTEVYEVGDWLKIQVLNEEEIDRAFDDLQF